MPAPPTHLPEQVRDALAGGATVLTANQRAARTLRREFDLHNLSLGLESWQPPAILAWDAWTAGLWRRFLLDGHASAMLLNRTQELALWRAVVEASQRGARSAASLRPVDALAETAAGAWELLHAYRGQPRLRSAVDTFDAKTFERWANAFSQLCRARDYLSQSQLEETLRASFGAGQLAQTGGLLLVGFDAQTPAQAALLEAIAASGARVDELALAPATAHTLATAADPHSELTAAALWLRAELTAHPEARIAVIVPALDAERSQIDRVFRRILAPELEDIAAPTGSGPFEFSLGIPLASTPMVATAFDILRWALAPLALERVSALLLSPHFAAATPADRDERVPRAEFDAFTLRREQLLRPEVSIDTILRLVSNSRTPALAHHLWMLRRTFQRRELTSGERTHSEWVAAMHEVLAAAGWASQSLLDSAEFQTFRKWESALDELATLDFDGRRVSFQAALDALQRIATATLFAPESRNAPIQIMGPLESAGSTFDAIWFLRAGDLGWPATPTPNPLLPWHLQRELGVPGTDPARDAAQARQITARIAASAPAAVFSYAEESAEGHQRPSPALAGLAFELCRAAEMAVPEAALAPLELEAFADAASIPPPPDRVVPGGASVLQAQAQCGFRAFAEKRLFAAALDPVTLGLNPGERGSIVHDVLEQFWEQVESHAALVAMPRAERDALLAACIDLALRGHVDKIAFSLDFPWDRAYLDTERRRLKKLLGQWLDYEAERPAFTVKAREERLDDVQLGPLRLNIRVDRVDLTPGGDEIIVDYKTGVARPTDWLGDRPDQPQLPLYAVVNGPANLAGVAFANVRAGENLGMMGYEAGKGVLPKGSKFPAATLQAQVAEWRDVLTTLAIGFQSGDASVSPKLYPATCKYCQQRLLCRLDPATLTVDLNAEDEDEAMTGEFAEAGLG